MRKIDLFFSMLFGVSSFVMSLFIFPYYTGGDQFFYINFYENIKEYTFIEGLIFYKSTLGSIEPVYYIIVVLFNFFNKTLLFSLINGLFGFCLATSLLKRNFHPLLLFFTLLNFYLLVLFFSAERLKISLLFLLLAYLVNNSKTRTFFLFIAVLSHVQTFILILSSYFSIFLLSFKKNFIEKIMNNKFNSIIIIGLLVVVVFYLKDHIIEKFMAYSANGGMTDILKPIFFMIMTLFYRKNNKFETILIFTPIIIASFFLGEERIVIFSYFIFFYFAMLVRRGFNFGMIIIMIYFSFKGFVFIENVLQYNDGFF